MEITIWFVYHSNGGMVNGLFDWAQRVFRPSTYPCNLYALSHHSFGMKAEWRDFIAGLPVGFRFLHRDEFYQRFGKVQETLPAAFLQIDDRLTLWIRAEEIKRCNILGELKNLVRRRLEDTLEKNGWVNLKISS